MNSWYTYILVGLDTKIMFLLKVVAKLWPVFSNCKFHSGLGSNFGNLVAPVNISQL